MSKKINVAVLMGGKSSEHEISLLSGREVVKNLNRGKYNVIPINISRDGRNWQVGESENFFLGSPAAVRVRADKSKAFSLQSDSTYPKLFKDNNIDLVFIALHGSNGEDGRIQGFLDLIDIPYTGSKVLASALAMDKIYSRKLFTQVGLKTPNFVVITKGEGTTKIFKKLKLPVFIKPNNQGSSVGTAKVIRKKDIKKALNGAHKFSQFAVVEEFISGTEVTCAVIGNDKPKALPLIEIVPKKEFFDYEAKYNERLCDEIVPARISKTLTKKTQGAALAAYQILGCRGFGRVDMIIKNNKVYVLEANTIPGLTPVSLLPKAAKAAGISYRQLLNEIISFAYPIV